MKLTDIHNIVNTVGCFCDDRFVNRMPTVYSVREYFRIISVRAILAHACSNVTCSTEVLM